ncbi:MAG: Na/Pi symporter [Chloroflexota bacterium]
MDQLFIILPGILGGVGLFLVGMILMSEGLKSAAGSGLQRILEKVTGTPLAAFFSGAGLTALVQSSSATTITTIGFVSAGLLTFPAALGVIVGANVGTTSTGWIVSLLGFKLNVGTIALPFIGVGALMKLLSSGRRAHFGMAIVGFGLIFVGIDFLQEGMGGLAQTIDLSGFAHTSFGGRLGLVLVGALMTVLLQSSSAAVALTLTALFSGAIGLEQAAYLVIGQNLGTTVKAVLAALGASVPAQRTAVGHILFNLVTAIIAFAAAHQLLNVSLIVGEWLNNDEPAFILALFHTIFNLLGALLVLPVITPFARLVVRLVPDRGPVLTRHLDKSLFHLPAVAVGAAGRAIQEIAIVTLAEAENLLRNGRHTRHSYERLWAAQSAMQETGQFLGQIQSDGNDRTLYARRLALLHAGDHASRLIEACLESEEPLAGTEVIAAAAQLAPTLAIAVEWLNNQEGKGNKVTRHLKKASKAQAKLRRDQRAKLLEQTAAGLVQPDEAQRYLESMRWVDRIGYHSWRMLYHLVDPLTADVALAAEAYSESDLAAEDP